MFFFQIESDIVYLCGCWVHHCINDRQCELVRERVSEQVNNIRTHTNEALQ